MIYLFSFLFVDYNYRIILAIYYYLLLNKFVDLRSFAYFYYFILFIFDYNFLILVYNWAFYALYFFNFYIFCYN